MFWTVNLLVASCLHAYLTTIAYPLLDFLSFGLGIPGIDTMRHLGLPQLAAGCHCHLPGLKGHSLIFSPLLPLALRPFMADLRDDTF